YRLGPEEGSSAQLSQAPIPPVGHVLECSRIGVESSEPQHNPDQGCNVRRKDQKVAEQVGGGAEKGVRRLYLDG
ncbi:hypothetical protein PIB30_115940, partial [Stylosanthes scabra]|nr:hypothetical protein [Stylosanthes scabra]